MLKQAQVFDTDKLTTGTAIRLSKPGYGYINALILDSNLEHLSIIFVKKDQGLIYFGTWARLLDVNQEIIKDTYKAVLSIRQFEGKDAIQLELLREA